MAPMGLRVRGLLWMALAGAAWGCSSTPSMFEPVVAGGSLAVEVLPGPWVRLDGERMPEDEFFLRMRLLLRAAGWDVEAKPGLRVTAEEGLSHTRLSGFCSRVIEDLGRWGLPGMELEQG